jgi:hypothetical protein
MSRTVKRRDLLGFRVRAQQLDREQGTLADTAILDLGVQDTGPDGGQWALAIRGVDVAAVDTAELAILWTLRGAPHRYRRTDLPAVAAAVAPMSDVDAGKRIFDASRPLKAAGIGNLEALDVIARHMRTLAARPIVKGDLSSRLTDMVDEPYLRHCKPCDAIHLYEQPFRLAAIRAGLELEDGTSPPVLRRIPGFKANARVSRRFDVVRGCLRFLGPVTPKRVAEFVDAPVAEVKAHWPGDAVEVSVDGERRSMLPDDVEHLDSDTPKGCRLLGPFDLFLQARDRSTLVADKARAKTLWPVIGRPGAVLFDGDLAGTWRPRAQGPKVTVAVELWTRETKRLRAAIEEQAERLAAYRQVTLKAVTYD